MAVWLQQALVAGQAVLALMGKHRLVVTVTLLPAFPRVPFFVGTPTVIFMLGTRVSTSKVAQVPNADVGAGGGGRAVGGGGDEGVGGVAAGERGVD